MPDSRDMAAGIFRQRKGALSMKRYGYHRTSTREQHLDRGIKEITAYCEQNGLELEKIFTGSQTGKNYTIMCVHIASMDI